VGLVTSFTPATHAADTPARRLNIIAIVTDDQGHWSLGAYGNRDAKTPNLDRLAAEGAIFTNAFVTTPVCSPSRASFLTGLYGTQVSVTDWINMNESAQGVGLPPETVTWPEVLKAGGYATALVGKWHLGRLPQHHPTRHGYDHFWGMLNGGTSQLMNPLIEVGGETKRLKGYVGDLLTDESIRWIEANAGKPFALSMHFREPHLPYGPVPKEDSAPFRESDPAVPDAPDLESTFTKDLLRKYHASVHSIDRNLGRLFAKLDELKLSEHTIILFTSDHGYNVGHHTLHGKGNAVWIGGGTHGPKRPNMFDTSMRVPLLVRWPGVVEPSTRIEGHVSNVDTFATVLGMLGVPQPADHMQYGRDFSPLLRGDSAGDWPTEVFGQYDLHNAGIAFMRMVRTPRWKLVRHHMTNGHNELYDLAEDPGETRNRYYDKKVRDVRDTLQERLTAWQASINDPILRVDADRPIEPGPPVGE
jgi:uncharacterized sulfatase